MTQFICRAIFVGNSRRLNCNFFEIAQTATRFCQVVDTFAAIFHSTIIQARHCLQIKIKRPVGCNNKIVFVFAHNAHRHRISAGNIHRVCAERQFDAVHAVFADVKVHGNFFNLNFVADKFAHVLNRFKFVHIFETELLLEIFKRGIRFGKFAVKIRVRFADENINEIVKNSCGD